MEETVKANTSTVVGEETGQGEVTPPEFAKTFPKDV
jgi:hypothetical protein